MRMYFFQAYLYMFFALFSTSCKSQTIIYVPIGLMDKPLPEIYIQETCNQDGKIKCFALNKSSLKLLEEYIIKQRNIKEDDSTVANEYPYGSYKVTLNSSGTKRYLILYGKEASSIFFARQLDLLQSNRRLYNEIQVLLKRLE